MPRFSLAPSYAVVPMQAAFTGHSVNGWFDATAVHVWEHLLANPLVGTKEGSCVRGVVFDPDTFAPTQLNVAEVNGLVLDVDEFQGEPILLDQALRVFNHLLSGCFHVVYTTYNSTPAAPRYRVIVPISQPLPRTLYRSLFRAINESLGNLVGEAQNQASRLGYLPRLKSEAHRADYYWWVVQGPVLDVNRRFGTLVEVPDPGPLFDHQHTQQPDVSNFLPDDVAESGARSYTRNFHVDVQPGDRHGTLFKASCKLFWDFWLPPETVRSILLDINSRFSQPKSEAEVLKEVEAGFERTRGRAAVPQRDPIPGCKRLRPPQLTVGKVTEMGRKLKRRAEQRDLGDALLALAAGQAFAQTNEALQVARSIARLFAEENQQSDPAQMAELFRPSLSVMSSQAGAQWDARLTVEVLRAIILSAQQECEERKQRTTNEAQAEQDQRIARAFRGARNTPYSREEFGEFARHQGLTPDVLMHQLIVQVGPSYFAFLGENGGTYCNPIEHGIEEYLCDALAATVPLGVAMTRTTRTGETKIRPVKDLVRDYGVVADGMVVSLSATCSYYDTENKTFVYATSPLRRKLIPERSLEVEGYLATIGSESALDWLAFAPRLDRPAKALYLWGAPGVGKSFLALCLSRLWSESGPSTGGELVDSFNDSVARCPAVFMDETLCADFRGRRGTEMLRNEIQSTNRPYKAKFRKCSQMLGALRFILAANHPNMIETSDTLTAEDAEGIKHRLLVVYMPEAAGAYLRALGRERTDRWLSDDLFAKHILYLRDTRELPPLGRFGPERNEAPTAHTQQVFDNIRLSGEGGQLLLWFYKALIGDAPPPPGAILWGKEKYSDSEAPSALLNLEMVEQYWQMVLGTHVRPPTRHNMKAAFKLLRRGTTRLQMGDKKRRYHVLDLTAFRDWLSNNEGDIDVLHEKIVALIARGLHEFTMSTGDDV